MDVYNEVLRAEERIRPHIRQTILDHSSLLSELSSATVHCKLENLQHTGSFKVRGAMNKLLSMSAAELAKGVVAASTGNHGMAVGWSLKKLEASGIVFVPENADQSKIRAIERAGAIVRHFGTDAVEAEVHARQYAVDHGMTYVPPYNDPGIVGGQGTIGLEIDHQLERIDAVFVSLGGGGLVSGIAGYLKSVNPGVRMFGCSPENSQVMIKSVEAGEILDLPSLPTLSDGTAGGVEAGSITYELCRRFVDEYVTVTEDEIVESLKLFMDTHHMLIEGAAAVAIASFLKVRERLAGSNVVIVVCGANISTSTLKEVIA
jgi:threonine dehydratase